MTIRVNGVAIGEEAVAREVQYHPAPSLEEAKRAAATALVVRELLAQRARRLGIEAESEDAAVEALLAREVITPEPDGPTCRRYYESNRRRFRSPDVFEATHILFPAHPEDGERRAAARTEAGEVLRAVLARPERFGELARRHSACPSAKDGGRLGRFTRGGTNEEVERALDAMAPGAVAAAPVASRHGYHILRLDRREPGRELGYDEVAGAIAAYLRAATRERATRQYLRLLAGEARIEGFAIDEAADGPLVQ